MVPFSSYLIWRMDNFILPLNKYDCDTLEKRWEIFQHYCENHDNVAECVRKLYTDFGGRREAPSAPYVPYLVKTVRTPENIAAVAESVRKPPSTSIHRRSQLLELLRKWAKTAIIEPRWTNFCPQKLKRTKLATFDFNRTALRATQPHSWCRLVTSMLRIDTVGLLLAGCRQR